MHFRTLIAGALALLPGALVLAETLEVTSTTAVVAGRCPCPRLPHGGL